jgi:RimJ/RimL family protein N-acetyltransferase
MSQVSRRSRFQSAPPRLTNRMLDHLVDDVDQFDHVAVLLLAPADHAAETPVGVGRIIRYAQDPSSADIALAVADDWQNRGVGSALAGALVRRRPAGLTHLRTVVSAQNTASLAILAKLGHVERTRPEAGQYDVSITLD